MTTYCRPSAIDIISTDRHAVLRADADILAKTISSQAGRLEFGKITPEAMEKIWPLLSREQGRTTDFSYGGVLMWVEIFKYEYAIVDDTLFIKGRVENDLSSVAFSLPVGSMPLADAVAMLRDYCRQEGMPLIFSAVPEYALESLREVGAREVSLIPDMGDYLYSAVSLATLTGKKYGKKRNHVNQFVAAYPDWRLEALDSANAREVLDFMDRIDAEGDNVEMAVKERRLNREVIRQIASGDGNYIGAILRGYAGGGIVAFTVGDIKGDTLFVHIEKALREVAGAFEMINKAYAEWILQAHPEVEYINREDDSGDIGLRISKESYHPLELLRKYNVSF